MSNHPVIPNPYAEVHKAANGPGDARPTALQIVKDNDLIGKLHDKTILVTGGTDGLGLETVRALAQTGAKIFFSARSPDKAKNVLQQLKDEAEANKQPFNIDWIRIDNADLQSVKDGAAEFLKKSTQLNVLITNAGISAVPEQTTKDGHEVQFQTNHLAHFLLFQLLKPLLLKSSTPSFQSRVVSVSSMAHSFSTVQLGDYNFEKDPLNVPEGSPGADPSFKPMLRYGHTKTANIWFANEIERRYGNDGIHAISIHPGAIITNGWGNVVDSVRQVLAEMLESDATKKWVKNKEQGAATQVLAAVGKDYEGKGGFFMSDCFITRPLAENEPYAEGAHSSWAYNEEGEKRLWIDSQKLLNLTDD